MNDMPHTTTLSVQQDNPPHLLPEILLEVMEILARRGQKKTMLRLMLTCHTYYALGLLPLLRYVSLYYMPNIDSFFSGVFRDSHFAHVRMLNLNFNSDVCVNKLVRLCIPTLEHLAIYVDSCNLHSAWQLLDGASHALTHLTIDITGSHSGALNFSDTATLPISVRSVQISARIDYADRSFGLFGLFAALERSSGLETISFYCWESMPNIEAYPIMKRKITKVSYEYLNLGDLLMLSSYDGLKILAIDGDQEEDGLTLLNFWHLLWNFEQLEEVRIYEMKSSDLASVVKGMKRPMALIIYDFQWSGLQPQDFDSVKDAIEVSPVSKITLYITYVKNDMFRGGMTEEDLAEEKFWQGIQKVLMICENHW